MTLKIAELTPTPRARVSVTSRVRPGSWRNRRTAWLIAQQVDAPELPVNCGPRSDLQPPVGPDLGQGCPVLGQAITRLALGFRLPPSAGGQRQCLKKRQKIRGELAVNRNALSRARMKKLKMRGMKGNASNADCRKLHADLILRRESQRIRNRGGHRRSPPCLPSSGCVCLRVPAGEGGWSVWRRFRGTAPGRSTPPRTDSRACRAWP